MKPFRITKIMLYKSLIMLLNGLPLYTFAGSTSLPTVAIIIDDVGHHYQNGTDLINLPYPLTLAFLPGRKYTQALSEMAFLSNKEVMLHAPMENVQGLDLGYGGMTSHMPENEIKQTLFILFATKFNHQHINTVECWSRPYFIR